MRSRVTSNSCPISSSVCSRSQPMPCSQPDDFLFLRRERLQNARGFVADVAFDHRVHRRPNPAVFDLRPEPIRHRGPPGFRAIPDPSNRLQLLHLLDRNVHTPPDLVVSWCAAQFFFQFPRCSQKLVHALVHMNRDADGPRLVGDRACDRLADPPCGVSREFVSPAVFELVGRARCCLPESDPAGGLTYFFATETTRRKFTSTRSFLARSASCSP